MLRLAVLDTHLAICRLEPDQGVPGWAMRGDWFSVTKTDDELSVVCPESQVPEGVQSSSGWRAIRVVGSMDLGEVGVMARLASSLAGRGVSLFAVSTFDTDYLLVHKDRLAEAIAALGDSGQIRQRNPRELNRQDAKVSKRMQGRRSEGHFKESSLNSLFFPPCELGVLTVQLFGLTARFEPPRRKLQGLRLAIDKISPARGRRRAARARSAGPGRMEGPGGRIRARR